MVIRLLAECVRTLKTSGQDIRGIGTDLSEDVEVAEQK
jgi:hypothetical protein